MGTRGDPSPGGCRAGRASAMFPLDAEISRATALVVDGNPTTRSVLCGMLREFGLGKVQQASRVQDARRMLEHRRFDIVVCEYHFDGDPMTGQDLIDDLRLAQLMPLSTIFVMISSERSYTSVAEAAEAAMDAYILKPHTQQTLRERLQAARQRKLTLRDIIEKIEKEAFAEAADLCQQRFEAKAACWLQAARIGAELYLRLAQPVRAQQLFEAVLASRALPWAKLGLARSQSEQGGLASARRTLESLVAEQPGYTDAYDVMGRVLVEQGEYEEAHQSFRRACELTPNNVGRLQKLGMLAYMQGHFDEAAEALGRAQSLGGGSRSFDLQSQVLLATLSFEREDLRGVERALEALCLARTDQPESPRLRRFEATVRLLHALLRRQPAEAVQLMRQGFDELLAPDFEFEAAGNLLMALAQMLRFEVKLDSAEHQVGILARRFAVSKTTCELLCRMAQAHPPFQAQVREAYARTCALAEEAVSHTVAGRPREAVAALLAEGERSFNSKLLDLAGMTLQRHAGQIPDALELGARVEALRRSHCSYGVQVKMG